MRKSVIVSAVRTPVGSFQGALSNIPATKLGSIVIAEAVKRAGIEGSSVEYCIMGCVLSGGTGQSPARQAILGAGLPDSVQALTINKVCGSGLKSVMLADQMIRSGDYDIIIAGGMENMTMAPYALPKARAGYRMGNGEIIDTMVNDGLWDVYSKKHMGALADHASSVNECTRQMQDDFAAESYRRAQKAISEGVFKDEIVPVEIPQRKGNPLVFDTDEGPAAVDFAKIPGLRAAFTPDGAVTAANASSINDGAAAFVIMSEEKAKELGITPLAAITGHAGFSHSPTFFTTAPTGAMKRVFEKTKVKPEEVDLYEINEAFSFVTLNSMKDFNIPHEKVNIRGGAVAIGHPIGASGARILTTLIYAMKHNKAARGMASLCIGGGESVAMMLEQCE
ncbi:acetyl-CoA C-acetyltransferase [Myxococcota bacterium]|nr:acetyl-CoA C-acetyltransferase [Myxococcota bacterium]MBU1382498.1 acetyl-CoA C-acetyltransferase [Myxococcota bacterium]MBU1497940.1 acetyl-CoA C-acetyltransferase [Myxococcota bacterium]